MTMGMLFLASGLVIVFYLVIANRITAFLHPLRLDMAELGAFLLECKDLPEPHRQRVIFHMDHAYSSARSWLYVVLMPFAVAAALRDVVSARRDNTFSDVPADIQTDLRRFCTMSFISVAGNSPLAAALIILQLVLYGLLWLPIGEVVRELMRTAYSVEQASAHLSANLEHWKQTA